jgi:hypothetical protein
MVGARQELVRKPVGDPRATLDAGFDQADLFGRLKAGNRIAVAVGSRKIDLLVPVIVQLVGRLRASGCEPFIFPAMGSHGGATAEGQAGLLAGLGVSEKTTGVPIESSMETVRLGETRGGVAAFVARGAMESDGIVVVNRVAPHTGYSGPVQSGAVKMLAVGLGKAPGAGSLHRHGFGAGHLIGELGDLIIEKAPVIAAIALVEDGARGLSHVEVLDRDDIRRREPELLKIACSMWPSIPVSSADILVVDKMGKDMSGTGMDPLVTGRGKEFPSGESPDFSAKRLVVLGLSPGSGGNATGVGHADIITEKLFREIDFAITYRNVMTSGAFFRARIPFVATSDRDAVSTALESLGGLSPKEARVVRIRNTRELAEFQVSTALAGELEGKEGISIAEGDREMAFDSRGRIL